MGAVSWAQRRGRFPVPFGFAPMMKKAPTPLPAQLPFKGMDAFVLLL